MDRIHFAPSHDGELIFPASPLFSRLLRFAHQKPPRIVIKDDVTNTEATHLQLLADVLHLRNRLRSELEIDKISCGTEVYIAVLAAGGYEYAVAMLAVLALGVAAVPLTTAVPPAEALYYVTKSHAIAVLTSTAALKTGVEVEKLVKNADSKSQFMCIPIAPSTFCPMPEVSHMKVSSGRYLDENEPAVVIFTSGTTGPPKGAVMRRSYVFDCALSVADHYNVRESDVLLHVLPVHHATGIGIMFFPFLVAGACIEFRSGSFDAQWTWDRWRKGGLTHFSAVPTIYMRMMRFFQDYLEQKPGVESYITGAQRLRACLCGTSALPSTIADFWSKILSSPILLRYGGSEFGAVLKVQIGDENVPEGSVGKVFSGVDLKLSHGDQGEILVKSPYMFSKYLFDEDSTRKAHDRDGYYKTGDIGRRVGSYYWILGRESLDILKSGGYKISALDIERELMALDYISECIVVGVADAEFGQRVAVALVPRSGTRTNDGTITLTRVRKDLGHRLARYKLPTILRVVEGELPKTGTGKVSKKTLGPEFFPSNYRTHDKIQYWESGLNYNAPKAHL